MDQDAPRTQAPRRLTRSTRERMWAGVAGGMGEYFEVDPVIVRLIWMAATVLTGGLAIPLYIALWIIMPREDQADPSRSYDGLRDGTRQFAAEARQMADDVAGSVRSAWQGGPTTDAPSAAESKGAGTATAEPAESATDPLGDAVGAPPPPSSAASSDPYPSTYSAEERGRHWGHDHGSVPGHGSSRRQRTAGFVLVAIGALLLLGNTGAFRIIPWHIVWPLVIVGVGIALLMRGQERRW
jgi:phage shock protein C